MRQELSCFILPFDFFTFCLKRPCSSETVIPEGRYAVYIRRPAPKANEQFDPAKHGHTYVKKTAQREKVLDNSFVVSHNRYLLMKYKSQ